MRIAVIADIHGNLPALERVLADIAERNVDGIIDLGDCVSGPLWPRETFERLQKLGAKTVRGNHDRIVGEADEQGAGLGAWGDAHAHAALSADQRAALLALPFRLAVTANVLVFHASPGSDTAYFAERVDGGRLVADTPGAIALRLGHAAARVVLCGHSHLARLTRLPDGRFVINPGSVGCPAYADDSPPAHVSESGSPHARYAVLNIRDGHEPEADFIALAYDWEKSARRAEGNGGNAWARALRTGAMS